MRLPDRKEAGASADNPGPGRQQDASVPRRVGRARQPRQNLLPMGVLAPGNGEEHQLGVGLGNTHVPGDYGNELARPPLNRKAQARQGSLSV
eukprot:2551249-Alexandrium_andersonii.AAC.1